MCFLNETRCNYIHEYDIKLLDINKRNILHLSIIHENHNLSRYILENIPVDINARDYLGYTALYLLMNNYNRDIFDLLLSSYKNTIDVNIKTNAGYTIGHKITRKINLHRNISDQEIYVLKKLVENNLDMYILDNHNQSSYDYLLDVGYDNILDLDPIKYALE